MQAQPDTERRGQDEHRSKAEANPAAFGSQERYEFGEADIHASCKVDLLFDFGKPAHNSSLTMRQLRVKL